MVKTKAGLPNTCSVCAEKQTTHWYAKNDEIASSGGGMCGQCSGMEEKPRTQSIVSADVPVVKTTRRKNG
jgi:hypothetical protein